MPKRITEFHSIMPIVNIVSVLKYGILSHAGISKLPHADVSLPDVQDKRARKSVPHGLRLHQYANLYFHARNPMMYKRQYEIDKLCILRLDKSVTRLKGVVFTDQNAASDYVLFLAPREYEKIKFDWVFAEDWTDPDQIMQWRKTSAKCAEVLVPHCISAEYINGAYVVGKAAKAELQAQGFTKPIKINAHLFFR
jgi:hypothetical protein